MSLSNLRILSQMGATISKTMVDGQSIAFSYAKVFSNLPSDASVFFNQGYAITAAGSEVIDVNTSLEDALGTSIVFTRIYALMVQNTIATSGKYITVASTIPFIDGTLPDIVVGPHGCLLLASTVDGYAVTASSADTITIANPGNVTITVHVAIAGK